MKTEYEITQKQLDDLMDASKPVRMIMLQCRSPRSPQENANAAWKKLGDEMGFDHMTVEPTGRGDKFFKATPRKPEE